MDFKRTSGDYLNYSIVKIGQNTENSPLRLEETCYRSNTSERSSANTDLKNSQGVNNNNNNNNNSNNGIKTMEHEGEHYTNCDWCFWYCN